MPEQPEVERAARELREKLVGRAIAMVEPLHPTAGRALGADERRSVTGMVVTAVERRGKHQLILLDDGRVLHAHFRMAGSWSVGATDDALPRHARLVVRLADGGWIALVDPRALATVVLLPSMDAAPVLGPEADDPALTAAELRRALVRRRGPIKPVLLDQSVLAGVGNIYASEALWRARISPRAAANGLGTRRLATLLEGIRAALAAGAESATRYSDGGDTRLHVYGREGEPCDRCGTPIRRTVQAGRSTFFCPQCQRR
ncbi:MAG TPA: DNA-formamidopyrimidine glycosylase family protein [Gemmatimonadales bacterium]